MKNIAKLVAVLLCICMLFTSCTLVGQSVDSSENTVNSQKVENLEKLCKVWGYTKYNHPAFLCGDILSIDIQRFILGKKTGMRNYSR